MSIMNELKKLARPYDEDGGLVDDDLDMELDEPVYTRPTAAPSRPDPTAENPVNMGTAAAAPTAAPTPTSGLGGLGSMSGLGGVSEPVRSGTTPITMPMTRICPNTGGAGAAGEV